MYDLAAALEAGADRWSAELSSNGILSIVLGIRARALDLAEADRGEERRQRGSRTRARAAIGPSPRSGAFSTMRVKRARPSRAARKQRSARRSSGQAQNRAADNRAARPAR